MLNRSLLPIMIAVCMLFTSCLHPISIDNCGYVVVIGVDEGAEERYEITFELQRESSGEAQENNGGAIILSVEAKDIFDAVNIISRGIEYDLNFTRTHALIFSEKIALNGEIGDFMDFSFDVLRIRRSALMIVTECGVREYIGGLAANNDANIAKLQDDLISDMEMTGELAAINIAHFLEACEEGRFDAVMPVGHYDGEIITDTKQHDSASKGDDPIKDAERGKRIGGMQGLTYGAAVFDGKRMTGILDPHDTQIMNIGRGDFKSGTVTVTAADKYICEVYVMPKKRIVEIRIDEPNPKAKMRLIMSITVKQDPEGKIGKDWQHGGKELLETYFEDELQRIFEKLLGFDSDAYGFGKNASMCFDNAKEWEEYDWKSRYGSLSAEFEVELTLDDEYIVKYGE